MAKNDGHGYCTYLCSMHMLYCAIGLHLKITSFKIKLLAISRWWHHKNKLSVGLFWIKGCAIVLVTYEVGQWGFWKGKILRL